MATKKRRKKAKKKTAKKNQVPLKVLETRLEKLNRLVKRRGGSAF